MPVFYVVGWHSSMFKYFTGVRAVSATLPYVPNYIHHNPCLCFMLWVGIHQGYFIGTRTVCATLLKCIPRNIHHNDIIHARVLCCGLAFFKVTSLVPEQCVPHCHMSQEIYIIIHACVSYCGLAFFNVTSLVPEQFHNTSQEIYRQFGCFLLWSCCGMSRSTGL